MSFTICEANWEDQSHGDGLLEVLDTYASEEMGGGTPLSPDVRARLVPALREQPHALVLLAFEGAAIAGAITCFFGFSTFAARPLLNVHDLAVMPAFRGQGVGRALLKAAEERALRRGCVKMTLEVREDNSRARRLYQHVGFGDFELAGAASRTLFLAKSLVPLG